MQHLDVVVNDDYDYDENTDLAPLVHALYVSVQHLLVVLGREKAILAPM